MSLPTFSQLDLAEQCQFPWLSGFRWKRKGSAAMNHGAAVHRVAEFLAIWGDAPVGDIAEEYDIAGEEHDRLIEAYQNLELLLHEEAETDQWRMAEVAVAIDIETGKARLLEDAEGRRYRLRKNERAGTIDLVRKRQDGLLVVRDYKGGWYKRFTRPIDDAQLMIYGLAIARAFDVDRIGLEMCHTDDECYVEAGELDDLLLDWCWDRTQSIYAAFDDWHNTIPKPGMHCRELFCPIVDKCPATQATLVAITKASKPKLPMVVEIESLEHAQHILERLPAAKEAIKRIDTALREFATKTPIPVSEGKVWAMREHKRRKIDISNNDAYDVLAKRFDPMRLDESIEKRLSKTVLKELIKDKAAHGQAAAMERAIMAELEQVDGIKESTFTKFGVVKQ